MTTTAKYPPKAAQALGFLKSNQNDIDFFVEDASSPNLWIKLLKNVIPDNIRLQSVSILGGRENVLDACKADQNEGGRPRLYIIDADLDILRGNYKPKLKHLYRLRSYCVENYIIQLKGMVFIATSYDNHVTEAQAIQRIDYDGWQQRNKISLKKLFICYATANLIDATIPTVSYSVHSLFKNGERSYDLCPELVNSRIFRINRQLLNTSTPLDIRNHTASVLKNIKDKDFQVFVSGKSYILPSIYGVMKSAFGINCSIRTFSILLASQYTGNFDPYFKRRINQISRQVDN